MQPASSKTLTCPSCGRAIERAHLKDRVCPFCNGDFDLAHSYLRLIALLTFASVVFLATITHEPSSDGGWLLGIILSSISIWTMYVVFIPPWLQKGHAQPRITVGVAFLTAAITFFLILFLGFGTLNVLLASGRERQEYLEILSMPLVWINPNFLITVDKSLSHWCGVILGNSMFYGLVLFTSAQLVRRAFHRSRPTQLSIGRDASADDPDEQI